MGPHRDAPAPSPSHRTLVLAAALVVAVLAVQIALFRDLRTDDAYITYRYGENLARGLGLVFNPHARLMGSTSPGECLLSAAVYRVVGHEALPSAMDALGCVGWMAQALLLHRLVRPLFGRPAALFVAGAVAAGAGGGWEWVPFETNLACACSLFGVVLALESRWAGAAVVLALGAVMRADVMIAAGVLAALCLRELRLKAWKPAAILTGVFAPWLIFATLYFGTPVPQTAIAKFHQTGRVAYALHLLRDVPDQSGFELPLVAKAAFFALAAFGVYALVRREPRAWVFPAWGALHALAYVYLAPDVIFQWHTYPVALVAAVLALLGAVDLTARLVRPARVVLAVATIAACAAGAVRFARVNPTLPLCGQRDAIYREISAYLATVASPDDIVDAEEVGTVGYYTGLRMNDHASLVTKYPGDVFWRLAHGRPTKLRWMIVNGAQITLGRERPYYEGHIPRTFTYGGWKLWLYDLKDGAGGMSPVP